MNYYSKFTSMFKIAPTNSLMNINLCFLLTSTGLSITNCVFSNSNNYDNV